MKKNIRPKIVSNRPKSGPKLSFLSFSQVSCISFSKKIAQNDNLEQCLMTSGGKTHKNIGSPHFDQMAQKRAKNQVFVTFSSLGHQFSWKLHSMIAWNIVQIKPLKKNLGAQNWVRNQGRVCALFSRFHHQFSLILPKIEALYNV